MECRHDLLLLIFIVSLPILLVHPVFIAVFSQEPHQINSLSVFRIQFLYSAYSGAYEFASHLEAILSLKSIISERNESCIFRSLLFQANRLRYF